MDYANCNEVRFPLMVTEEEALFLHALVAAQKAAPVAEAAPAEPAPQE